jgi:hypothetical protein
VSILFLGDRFTAVHHEALPVLICQLQPKFVLCRIRCRYTAHDKPDALSFSAIIVQCFTSGELCLV